MKDRVLYYRRKGKAMIIEGKQDGKSVLIWTLPSPQDLLDKILTFPSFFTREKSIKIAEKISRLDTREEKGVKQDKEVRIVITTRSQEKDETTEQNSEEIEEVEEADDDIAQELGLK